MSDTSETIATTPEQFEEFKSAFLKWRERFGLFDYRVVFEHAPLDAAFADITVDCRGCVATVRFSSKIHCVPGGIEPARHALHEALHLLLSRLRWIGECRFLDDSELRMEEERLVRILEYNLVGWQTRSSV